MFQTPSSQMHLPAHHHPKHPKSPIRPRAAAHAGRPAGISEKIPKTCAQNRIFQPPCTFRCAHCCLNLVVVCAANCGTDERFVPKSLGCALLWLPLLCECRPDTQLARDVFGTQRVPPCFRWPLSGVALPQSRQFLTCGANRRARFQPVVG